MIRLLVVDDSALLRRLMRQIFEAEADFELAFARDGIEALEQLHGFKPDVVTLDLTMPRMDGLECLDRIMVERPSRVVMLSSLTAAGAEETLEAMALGAVDFVLKPAGALSLALAEFAPRVVETVRRAAGARLRASARLAERLRARAASLPPPVPVPRLHAAALAGERGFAESPAEGLVLVGTSTGGPAALDVLLAGLPADFPWPVVIAQHMPATFTGPLARRLDRQCALRVTEVSGPQPLRPGQAYIGRGDADLLVGRRAGGLVALAAPSDPAHRWHPSVDRMVDSALGVLPPAALIGVLMTGMGYDGAAAMGRLHAGGGRTIAEAESSAVVWGMPGALAQSGAASAVLPLPRIAPRLLEWLA
ncbi:chemotaxis response regulator protein-glutamate methylesterase [Pseudoroseomonas deserti]|uniref:Protein-glutamate methylesterase/protein-glutamine glutaminase n=1 Tax=Teichococcus deserti TaxID=1817963 RepID=A0A1V2H7U6_9PROT|nr:chemotaxis-specific protein-glutamate methyltransferase CheB [Pseudoroseomonas deserti]ONG56743.1 chemotaxis response regulator protein-glutamate methylesterase [Pseudoroseomonas deserti]